MKWWLKVALALILVVIIAFVGISAYLGYSMTRVERVSIEDNPVRLGLEYEDVSFASAVDELTIRGWYLPAGDSEEVIIMIHGASSHRASPSIKMLDIAAGLVGHGYSVLTFDMRGHGESEGSKISGGYYEKRDLLGAVEYVKGRGFEHIGVLGFSTGAVASLLAAAESTDIDAVVEDCGFADLQDIIEPEFRNRTKSPLIFLRPLLFMVKIMYGIDFAAIKPVEVVSEIAPRPVFFIHSELDEVIPLEHVYRLKQASQGLQDQLWVVPQVAHVKAYATYPEEYLNKVVVFFDAVLK